MTPDPVRALAGWAVGLLFVGALLGGVWLHGYGYGKNKTEAVWQEKLLVAERAARQTEIDLGAIAAASAKRIAAKEAALDDQAKQRNAAWRALLAALPACRVPRAVGVQLDAAAGVSAAPAVAGPPRSGPDEAALDRTVDLAVELDRVRENYRICQTNIGRLTEARDWYNRLRERANSGAQP